MIKNPQMPTLLWLFQLLVTLNAVVMLVILVLVVFDFAVGVSIILPREETFTVAEFSMGLAVLLVVSAFSAAMAWGMANERVWARHLLAVPFAALLAAAPLDIVFGAFRLSDAGLVLFAIMVLGYLYRNPAVVLYYHRLGQKQGAPKPSPNL